MAQTETATGQSGARAAQLQPSDDATLVTGQGRSVISDSVVEKIAGLAGREVSGVYEMGSGPARALGALQWPLMGSSLGSAAQGVSVEVGERQAAVDLEQVVEYGVSIPDVAGGSGVRVSGARVGAPRSSSSASVTSAAGAGSAEPTGLQVHQGPESRGPVG